MTCEIVKDETCVLVPREYAKLREQMNTDYRLICDAYLHTGMRGTELAMFLKNHEWYKPSRRLIALPKEAIKKKKTRYKSRNVILSIEGCDAIQRIIDLKIDKMPKRQSFNEYLNSCAEKSGLGSDHICPKMFRKSIISWLVAIFPERQMYINHFAGHTSDVQLKNYLAAGFERRDIEDMRTILRGWGETVL